MVDRTTQDPGVFRLIYRSRDLIAPTDRRIALGLLFTQARAANAARSITGVLLLTAASFVQVLEGDEAAVRTVFDKIKVDRRHDQVRLLQAGPVTGRLFDRWAMARIAGDGHDDIALTARPDGIVATGGEPATSDQHDLLSLMRSSAV